MNKNKKGVVLEDIDSKLDLVLEGYKALDVKIDKNHEEFREFRKEANYKFGILTEMVAKSTEDITKLQADTSTIRELVAKNTEDIGMMKMDLHLIKDDLKEKVSREEFKVIEKRIDLLEKKFQKA
jgi:hypothetical protein